ncbi:MAG: ribosome maturation factor RimM [Candidatus Zixiibacteriota bacterium]
METKGDLILVGRLGRARGVHGWIWITPDTDFPERFGELDRILVSEQDAWRELEIEAAEVIGGRPVIKFVGIDSREDAARYTNRQLAVARTQLVALPPDTHYVFDLVGCAVRDADNGRRLGEIIDVIRYPANDVYVVRTDSGKDVLFPAVNDYVRKIDTVLRTVVVVSGGMFDDTDEKNGS